MSAPTSTEPGAEPGSAPAWHVREATAADAVAVAGAVAELLGELGGSCPSPTELEAEARAQIEDRQLGVVLLAEAGEELAGILVASWVRAMHVPGRYLLIQDLWVRPSWRSQKIGADLVDAIAELADRQGVARIEVGLPRETFAAIAATESFYRRNGFEPLGLRMRRLLP